MCGRFTLSTPGDAVADAFGLPSAPALSPRYNVAPAQFVAVVGLKPDGRTRGLALPVAVGPPDERAIHEQLEVTAARGSR